MEKQGQVLVVFDVDETLLYCDHAFDKENRYEKLKLIGRNETMVALLHFMILHKIPWKILTSRTYRTVEQIRKFLEIPEEFIGNICTRRHDLSHAEIDVFCGDKEKEKAYFTRMYRDKADRLAEWAERIGHVIMFDDLHAEMDEYNYSCAVDIVPPLGGMC